MPIPRLCRPRSCIALQHQGFGAREVGTIRAHGMLATEMVQAALAVAQMRLGRNRVQVLVFTGVPRPRPQSEIICNS